MSDKSESLLKFCVLLLLTLPSVLWSGFVLSVLWGWFAAPLGAPVLTVGQACGVRAIVGYLTFTPPKENEETSSTAHTIVFAALAPALALFFGWLIKVVIL
jgi:hypothetical protein